MSIDAILQQVAEERRRQDAQGYSSADGSHSAEDWLAILGRQVGHVCDEVYAGPLDGQHGLRHELVQVAAVCGAWTEALGANPASVSRAVAGNAPWSSDRHRLLTLLRAVGQIGERPRVGAIVRVAALAVAWAASLDGKGEEAGK